MFPKFSFKQIWLILVSGIFHQHCLSEKEHIACGSTSLYLAFNVHNDYGKYMQISELHFT